VKINGKVTVLTSKGCVCIFHESSREVSVSFKTRVGVGVIFINLMGGECNFPLF
jgi:hypothetical protein